MWPLFRRHFDRTLALAALGLALCAGLAGFGYWYYVAPTQLRVAVGPPESPEARLIDAYAQALVETYKDTRLRVVTTEDLRRSAGALQQKRVDLAVVRPDVLLPGNARTIAILRADIVVILAPAGTDAFGKLVKKRLGIITRDEADLSVLRTLLD